MKYEDITTLHLTKDIIKNSLLDDIVQQAKRLLADNLLDHEDTNLDFYEWVFVAQTKSGEVVGIITGNKYLPRKAMLCDIVTHKDLRGSGVGAKLLEALCQHLLDNNIPYITGFTSKNNTSALKTYKRFGAYQDEFIVSTSDCSVGVGLVKQAEMRLKYRTKKSNIR
jgi:ribosomal protein S18 acetylase RimI-like enzyme